jgi:uncharacterized protein
MTTFLRLSSDAAPIESTPGERILEGTPTFKTWNVDESGDVLLGLWEATPGKWRFAKEGFEFCHILSGVSTITEESGAAHTVRAGDSFVLRPGFRGTWEVLETTLKEYVLRR